MTSVLASKAFTSEVQDQYPGLAFDYQSSPPAYTTAGPPYGSPAGYAPNGVPMAPSYAQNTGGNDYSSTDDYSSYRTPQTSYQQDHHGKGKQVSYNSGFANHDASTYYGQAPGEYGDEDSEEEDDGEEDGEDGEDDEGDYYGDGDMTRAMEESRRAYYGDGQAAGSSSAYASAYAPGKFCPLVDLQLRTNNIQPRWMTLPRRREL
ncbi:hypothetical protein PG984_004876 [Apiospora sp. TS-2023a]